MGQAMHLPRMGQTPVASPACAQAQNSEEKATATLPLNPPVRLMFKDDRGLRALPPAAETRTTYSPIAVLLSSHSTAPRLQRSRMFVGPVPISSAADLGVLAAIIGYSSSCRTMGTPVRAGLRARPGLPSYSRTSTTTSEQVLAGSLAGSRGQACKLQFAPVIHRA
jgi:hypothetical protein